MSTARHNTARDHTARVLGLCAGAAAITLTLPSWALDATQLNRVEVAGQPLTAPARYDVHAACTGMDEQLAQPLLRAWAREQAAAEVNVSFVLQGQSISQVSAQGGPYEYHVSIKRAVRQLRCSDAMASSTPQAFTFQIAFIDEAAGAGPARTAAATGAAPYRIALVRR